MQSWNRWRGGGDRSRHDVDYLPMWADYSWTSNPARLIWHGLSMRENWETFFGAVSLLDKSVFTAVNGFPNCYWGWGPEDLEMSNRLRLRGYKLERRDGTFIPLPHKHARRHIRSRYPAGPGARIPERLAMAAGAVLGCATRPAAPAARNRSLYRPPEALPPPVTPMSA